MEAILKGFNDLTDAIYIRLCLLLASSLLAVLSVISPRVWRICMIELGKMSEKVRE